MLGEKREQWSKEERDWEDKVAKRKADTEQAESHSQQLDLKHKEACMAWEAMRGEKREQWSTEETDLERKLAKLKAHTEQAESRSQQLDLKHKEVCMAWETMMDEKKSNGRRKKGLA
jgi:hypothetical protein